MSDTSIVHINQDIILKDLNSILGFLHHNVYADIDHVIDQIVHPDTTNEEREADKQRVIEAARAAKVAILGCYIGSTSTLINIESLSLHSADGNYKSFLLNTLKATNRILQFGSGRGKLVILANAYPVTSLEVENCLTSAPEVLTIPCDDQPLQDPAIDDESLTKGELIVLVRDMRTKIFHDEETIASYQKQIAHLEQQIDYANAMSWK